MRILINNIQGLVSKFGKSIVLDKKFLNMLKDVYDFRNNPKLLNIMEELYAKDCINKIYKSSKKRIEKDIKSILSDTNIKSSFGEEDVYIVLYSFAIGINILNYKDYISLQNQKRPKAKKAIGSLFVKLLCKLIACTYLRVVLVFLAASICGLALFYVCEENGWWIFFCTIVLIFADLICVALCLNINIDDSTSKGKSVVSACGTIGTLKSCLPFFYIKDETSFLAILLIFALVFLWGASTVMVATEQSSKYGWKQIIISKAYIITTLFMLLIVGSFAFLSPIIAAIENKINENIRLEHSKIDKKLGYKSFYLSDTLPQTINNIASLQERTGVDTLGVKMDIFTFKDELYTDSTNVELLCYKGILAKISLYIDNPGGTYSEDLLKLYTEKYGVPEKPEIPISFFENPYGMLLNSNYRQWASDRKWTFQNGTIIISGGTFSFAVSYISNMYLKIEEKERFAEQQKILEQERKRQKLEELERQRYKNEVRKEEKLKKDKNNRTRKEI